MSDIVSSATSNPSMPDTGRPKSVPRGILSPAFQVRATLFPINGRELAAFTPEHISLSDLRQMRRDPMIALGLSALTAPLMNASRYYLQGGDDAVRAFLEATVMPHLSMLLEKILQALSFGFQAIELSWRVDDVVAEDDNGGRRRFRSKYVPDCFVDIDPERVTIVVDERTGEYRGVRFDDVPLPPERVLLATYQAEFGNLYGQSLLDPAWIPWKYSAVIRKLWGRFLERFAMGSFVGVAPAEPREDSAGNRQDPVRYLGTLLSNLLGAGVTALPYEPDPQTGRNMWDVRLLESSREGRAFVEAVTYFEAAKLRAILVPERVLTQDTAVGSHSMAESHSETFFVMLDRILDSLIMRVLNGQLLPLVTRINFGPGVRVPRMQAPRMSREMRSMMFDLLKAGLDAPIDLQDGRRFTPLSLINLPALLERLNVPSRRIDDAAIEVNFAPIPEVSVGPPGVDGPGGTNDGGGGGGSQAA